MKISTIHKKFAERLGKIDALENPQDYLGPNTSTVLNFWLYLDKLDKEQLKIVGERYNAAWYDASNAARNAAASVAAGDAAWDAARDAARDAAKDAAWYAAGYAAWVAAWYAASNAAAWATYELIGSHLLLEQGKSLLFVPMFDKL